MVTQRKRQKKEENWILWSVRGVQEKTQASPSEPSSNSWSQARDGYSGDGDDDDEPKEKG